MGRANIHTLRYTYASWLRQRSLGLDELQHLLGHSTLQMTMRYAKLYASATAARVEAGLSGILQQPVQQTAPHDAGVPAVPASPSNGTLPSQSV
ncbi:tyrosine-type recombinase/integrase [Roseomonas gilardii]|uniref:tyrosine-type recombinase/integrase n=1 Tax=Roseomonas gilardii TaxID=257708 RepID=UPI0011A653BB